MIRAHAAAVLTKIRSTGVTAYDSDEVPADPDLPYVVVYIDPARVADGRFVGANTSVVWRILVRFNGATADEARWAHEKTWTAVHEQRIVVPGRTSTRCEFESSEPVRPEDLEDFYSGSAAWTFTTKPA